MLPWHLFSAQSEGASAEQVAIWRLEINVRDLDVGQDKARLLADVIAGVPELGKVGRPQLDEGNGSRAIINSIGRGSDYLAARIKRDAPEIKWQPFPFDPAGTHARAS